MKAIPGRIFTVLLAVLLSFSSLGILNVKAQPFIHGGMVDPDSSTKPPTISVLSPKNNTTYKEDTINLSFNTSLGYSRTATLMFILEIYYKTDWENKTIFVYKSSSGKELENPFNLNLTNIPDGNHSIEITACEMGDYKEDLYWYTFLINGSSIVNFAVDSSKPDPISEPEFPTTTVLASVVILSIVAIGILAYFKKYKK
jgi:hypothetical protein